MLYIYHGTDVNKSREKAHKLIGSLRIKKPDAAYVPINADAWHASIIEEHLGGQGLFSNKYIVFLDRVTENNEAKESVSGYAQPMNESTNVFVVLEGKLNADLEKSFEKHAEKAVSTDLPSVGKSFGAGKSDFNIFALADAVGNRDQFRTWTVYRQAIDRGMESEGILGTLFWQIKSIMVANSGKTAAESGLSPFVYMKSKKYAANYSKEELAGFLGKLINLYHDGHRGMVDMELGTEALLLSL